MTYGGKAITYSYDAVNRMTDVFDGARHTVYSYDAADDLLAVLYPNGGSVGYTYDDAGRVTEVVNLFSGSTTPTSTPISSFNYVLDNAGNRTQITDGSGRITALTYDPLYRVTSTTVASKKTAYTYDAVGNRLHLTAPSTSIAYTYDAADRLLSAGSTQFTYDHNGNMVRSVSGKTQSQFDYDPADRLVRVAGGHVASLFGYDGDGNRTRQQVGSGVYNYLNDVTSTGSSSVLRETGPDGTIFYTRGRDLISAAGPSFTFYYQYEAQSTVVGLTDSTGHLAQKYLYDIWGQPLSNVPGPQVGTENKFGYTGEALDPGTSLYYLRNRYYDPTLGRFINKDPIEGLARVPTTLDRFIYAVDNPATRTERNGVCSSDEQHPKQNDCETP